LRQLPKTVASALLLGTFLVAVTSLASNMGLVDVSKLPNTSSIQSPTSPTASLSTPAAGIATPSESGLLVVFVVVLIVVAFLVRRRRGPSDPYAFWRLIGLVIGLAIIYEGAQFILSALSSSSGGFQAQQAEQVTAIASLGAVLVAGLAIAIVVIRDRTSALRMAAAMDETGSAKSILRTIQSIRARLYSMPEPEVYRDSVIACYSAMTGFLSRRGAEDRPSYTPHELEASATGKVGSLETDVHALTRLFEKARYASSPVTERDAQESVDALERMTGGEPAGER